VKKSVASDWWLVAGKHLIQSGVFRLAPRPSPLGFTYIGLLLLIALMGTAVAGAAIVHHQQAQREKEKELLFVGEQFRRAIGQYYEGSPGGDKRFPATLEDLLSDSRYPSTKRYLRRIYFDPMTASREWGLIRGPGDRIIGVHSLSQSKPVKVSGFAERYADFASVESLSDWKFVYTVAPPAEENPPVPSAPAGR
jgi:type II secretory pathway pseudopilin PulG